MPSTEYFPSVERPLVAVDHPWTSGASQPATRIRVVGPWLDRTAGLLLDGIKASSAVGQTTLIDLSGCRQADTTQLAVLILGQRHAQRAGARLLVDGSCELRELAKICRIADMLSWANDSNGRDVVVQPQQAIGLRVGVEG